MSLPYILLKSLSHNKNLLTDIQLSKVIEQNSYDSKKTNIYLKYISKYLNYNNKSIIEIGCGAGDFAISLAKTGAQKVLGVDIDRELINTAQKKAKIENIDDKISFKCSDFNSLRTNDLYDMAFSINAFEHIPSPVTSLKQIYNCLTHEGVFCTIFGPLWLSPYGAHMWEFTSIPWVHFLFPEKVVLKVRTEFYRPGDPVDRYEDVRGHLNRITVKKFMNYASEAGFNVETLRVNPAQDNGKYKFANAIINRVYTLKELCSFQLLAIFKKK